MSQKVTYFDAKGLEHSQDSNVKNNIAKVHEIGTVKKYYIKFFNFGPFAGTPFNPLETTISDGLIKQGPLQTNVLSFKEVNKECYDLYIRFLKERNINLYNTVLNMGTKNA